MLDRGERREAPSEAAYHLNNTLDTFNLPEHKKEGFKARKHSQCPGRLGTERLKRHASKSDGG